MSGVTAGVEVASRVHPLDPLSKAELESVIGALRRDGVIDHRHLIAMLQVEEPAKAMLASFRLGENIDRAARVTILDRSTGKVAEIVVTVGLKNMCRVVSNKIIEGAKAPVLSVESEMAIAAAKRDQRVIEALRSRGITDLDSV